MSEVIGTRTAGKLVILVLGRAVALNGAGPDRANERRAERLRELFVDDVVGHGAHVLVPTILAEVQNPGEELVRADRR